MAVRSRSSAISTTSSSWSSERRLKFDEPTTAAHAVDRHHLRVHHRRLEGPDRDPAPDQPLVGRPRWSAGTPACRRAVRAAAGRPRRRGRGRRRGCRGSRRRARSTPSRSAAAPGPTPSITWNADCMSSHPRLAEPRTICTVRVPRCGCTGNSSSSSNSGRPVSAQSWMNADCSPSTAGPSTRRWVSRHSFSLRASPHHSSRDADAAGEADPPVHHADLAVQPVVGLERRLEQRLAEPLDLDAGPVHLRRPASSRSAGRRGRR